MKLEKLDNAFQQRLKDHQFLALEKAKEGMELVKMQMTELFKLEWEKLVYNFNQMRIILQNCERAAIAAQS